MGYRIEQELVSTLKVQRKIAALPFFGVLNSHKTTSNQCLTSSFLILKGTMVSVAIDWTFYLSSVTKITIVLNKRNKCLLQNAIEGPIKAERYQGTLPLCKFLCTVGRWYLNISDKSCPIHQWEIIRALMQPTIISNFFKQASLQKVATYSIKHHPLFAAKDPCSIEVMKFIHR